MSHNSSTDQQVTVEQPQSTNLNDQLLEELLASSATGSTNTTPKNAIVAAERIRKQNYARLVAYQNVTSYSMQQTLHRCPREFQLSKLKAHAELEGDYQEDIFYKERAEEEMPLHFSFGHAVGAGIATYDQTRDLDKAIFSAFLAWTSPLLAEQDMSAPRTRRKLEEFHHAIQAIKLYPQFVDFETDLHEYEVVHLEANVAIDFEDGRFYVGHIDELLRHKESGKLRVKENKTSGYASPDPALFSNSEQTISYSALIQAHGQQEYEVEYSVYSKPEQRWIRMLFPKSDNSRVEWLKDQLILNRTLDDCESANFFPKRGSGCVRFGGRRCRWYEECDMTASSLFGREFSDLPVAKDLAELNEIEEHQYSITLTQLKRKLKEANEQQQSSSIP